MEENACWCAEVAVERVFFCSLVGWLNGRNWQNIENVNGNSEKKYIRTWSDMCPSICSANGAKEVHWNWMGFFFSFGRKRRDTVGNYLFGLFYWITNQKYVLSSAIVILKKALQSQKAQMPPIPNKWFFLLFVTCLFLEIFHF